MGTNVVGAEIVHRKEGRDINLLRYPFSRFDFQWGLNRICLQYSDQLSILTGHLESEPRLTGSIVQINVASGQIGDADGCDDRFVGNVLQPRQLEIDLNLGERRTGGEKKNRAVGRCFHGRIK